MIKDDKEFFDDSFREMREEMFPSKTKMAAVGIGVVLLNIVLFLLAVGVIAYAVKWVIS